MKQLELFKAAGVHTRLRRIESRLIAIDTVADRVRFGELTDEERRRARRRWTRGEEVIVSRYLCDF